jgi:hypothetical protein
VIASTIGQCVDDPRRRDGRQRPDPVRAPQAERRVDVVDGAGQRFGADVLRAAPLLAADRGGVRGVRTVREYVQWALGCGARVEPQRRRGADARRDRRARQRARGVPRVSNERLAVLADRHPDTARRLIRRLKRLRLITSGRIATARPRCGAVHRPSIRSSRLELELGALEAEQGGSPGVPGSPASRNKCSGGSLRRPVTLGAQAPTRRDLKV